MYSREVDGKEFTFGVSGKLIMNALVMYDRQTDSLWGQIIGEAIQGAMKGTRLEFIPAIHTTWDDWKRQHPDTLALRKGYKGSRSPYESYYESSRAGVLGETFQDERLYVKEFVIGVEHQGLAVAYPFGVLNEQPVLNDTIDDLPVLVVFNPETGAGAVFSRRLEDGRTLTFSVKERLILQDDETGSTWDGMAGMAFDGPLAGTQLSAVKYTSSFWFGWKDWHPHTRVYE